MFLSPRQYAVLAGLRQELEGGQRHPMFIDSSCTCIPRTCNSITRIPGPETAEDQMRLNRLRAAMRRSLPGSGSPISALLVGLSAFSGEFDVLHLLSRCLRSVGAPKSMPPGRCGRTQLSRLSCRRSLAYLAISSAEMCGM